MATSILKFKDWTFEVDKELTEKTYNNTPNGGADTCVCNDCKNYVAYREKVFPKEILAFFNEVGIDFRKEVEITTWQVRSNGLYHIGGWFHFKGILLTGKNYRVPFSPTGYTYDLTFIADNFSIGFAPGNDLTFFEENNGLVQVEFDTNIPWVINKSLKTE